MPRAPQREARAAVASAVVAALPQQVDHPAGQVADALPRPPIGNGCFYRRERHAGQLDLMGRAHVDRA
jgi:hypothetical protein